MKINQEISILFWLFKAKKTTDGKSPIYCRLTINGKRVEFSTGKKIEDAKWLREAGIVKGGGVEAQMINKELNMVKADIQRHYDLLRASNSLITAEILRNRYLGVDAERKTILDTFTAHNKVLRQRVDAEEPTLREKTWQRFEITQDKVKSFLKSEFNVSDILLSDIKNSFGSDFKHYLTTVDNLAMNTAMKYLKNTKQVFDFAVLKEWRSSNPMAAFKCTYRQPKRQRLLWDEIMKIYIHPMPIQRLEEVRDVYIFSCFTGYAYQDVYLLTPQNVVKWIDGNKWLIKDRFKTESKSNIPLMEIPLAIIEKYKNHPYCIKENKLLPVNSNQRYNGYLKEISNICGVNKTLTTHSARHTFATTILMDNDCPIESASEMLGHNSIRTTQIYTKVTDVKVSKNMREIKRKVEENIQQGQIAVNF